MIKPLEWREHQNSFPAQTWSAQTPFGFFNIEEVSASDTPAYEVRLHTHHLVSVTESLELAKAAARADYERRILSALSPDAVTAVNSNSALQARVVELEEALNKIVDANQIREFTGDDKADGYGDGGWVTRDGQYAKIARAALQGGSNG
jgi:hypothetical protein